MEPQNRIGFTSIIPQLEYLFLLWALMPPPVPAPLCGLTSHHLIGIFNMVLCSFPNLFVSWILQIIQNKWFVITLILMFRSTEFYTEKDYISLSLFIFSMVMLHFVNTELWNKFSYSFAHHLPCHHLSNE